VRGQVFDNRLSSVNDPWDWNRGRLILYYSSNHVWGQSGTDNNGNVMFSEMWIPPENAALDQADTLIEDRYAYDSLNRLKSVAEQTMTAAGGWVWSQQFVQAYDYDRFGNRTINAGLTWGTGINNKQFTVDAATNRLGVPSGQSGAMSYDNAGNLTTDSYAGTGGRTYDAENKMTSAQDMAGVWAFYTYDAEGHRTRRKINNQETWEIYGFDGELLADYPANGAATSPQKEYGYRGGQLLITADAPVSPPPPPTSGLVAYWKFDENTGATTADSSGNGHTGTLNGPAWTTGQANAALSFDGTNDMVTNNGISSLTNNFTLSFWAQPSATHEIDPESTSGFGGISGQKYAFWPLYHDSGHAGFGVSLGTNGVSVYEHAANYMPATLVYSGALTGWTHVTIVYENKQPKLYLNGNLVRTGLTSPMTFVHMNPAEIGGDVYGYYGGKLDDVRVYNRALSAAEVATLINSSGTAETFNASADFSNTQGYKNWYYVDENNTLMNYDGTNNVWVGTEGPYQWIWPAGGHPGSNHDVVRQWRASQAGNIRITGNVSDGDPGGGDGVVIKIKKGTQILWQQTIVNGNTTGLSYDLTTSVVAGDQISFSINKNSDSLWDSTNFNPSISFTTGGGLSRINWIVSDNLGTPRLIVDQSGTLANVKRHDYLPFGEELFAPTGGRTAALGYSGGDGVRQQFTSQERDTETGLDYFDARYYAPNQGRFTSVDPFFGSARRQTPQSWNRYSYALNNPLVYTDPSGEGWVRGRHNEVFWDPEVSTEKEVRRKYGQGYHLIDGRTLIIYETKGDSPFKVGHLYTFNADGTFTDHGVYLPPSIFQHDSTFANQMALAVLKLYGSAAWAGATGGTGTIGILISSASVASDFLLPEDAPDAELSAMAANITIDQIHDDWVTKGAHIKVDGVEIKVLPGKDGEIVFKSVFSSTPEEKVRAAINKAQAALEDSAFRARLSSVVGRAVKHFGKGTAMARAKSFELRMLVKAIAKIK
jgi:RHS repeat-associated protein